MMRGMCRAVRRSGARLFGIALLIAFALGVSRYALAQSGPTQQRFCEALPADDGGVARLSLAYPPAGTTSVNTTASTVAPRRTLKSTGDYAVGVGLLRFDTGALPDDAIITAARLELYVVDKNNANNRSLVGEFHPSSAWPIAAGSYTDVAPTQNLAFGVAVPSLPLGQVVPITLDAALADQQVSRTTTTGLRLHISGGQPSGINSVEFVTQDDPTRPEPCLVLDYVRPTPTATLTATPTATATATASATASATDTVSASATATATETATPTLSVAPSAPPTSGATDTPTATPTSEPSATATVTPSSEPSATATTTSTVTPTATPTSAASLPPTPTPTPTSIPVPTQQRFCEALSADDGGVARLSLAYPPAGTTSVNTTASTVAPRRTLKSTGDYSVGVGLLRFDTGALPDDAIITAARLELYVVDKNNANNRSLVGEFHPSSAWPIAAGSYTDVVPDAEPGVWGGGSQPAARAGGADLHGCGAGRPAGVAHGDHRAAAAHLRRPAQWHQLGRIRHSGRSHPARAVPGARLRPPDAHGH